MFWKDIGDVKRDINTLKNHLFRIEAALCNMDHNGRFQDLEFKLENIKIMLDEQICSENAFDKFEVYMQNVDKLNNMINEFKGCISLARSVFADSKKLDKEKAPVKKKVDRAS